MPSSLVVDRARHHAELVASIVAPRPGWECCPPVLAQELASFGLRCTPAAVRGSVGRRGDRKQRHVIRSQVAAADAGVPHVAGVLTWSPAGHPAPIGLPRIRAQVSPTAQTAARIPHSSGVPALD